MAEVETAGAPPPRALEVAVAHLSLGEAKAWLSRLNGDPPTPARW